jgi:PIN domain nuclease of toxin-antitoxin system
LKLLLDTHIALWLMRDAAELTRAARREIIAADEVFVSSASLWEASIKAALGKLPVDPAHLEHQLFTAGVQQLAVSWRHAVAVYKLPPLHRDPFDRLLVAQAISEPLHLLTHDPTLKPYSDLVMVI